MSLLLESLRPRCMKTANIPLPDSLLFQFERKSEGWSAIVQKRRSLQISSVNSAVAA
jgi:hypothetical protein